MGGDVTRRATVNATTTDLRGGPYGATIVPPGNAVPVQDESGNVVITAPTGYVFPDGSLDTSAGAVPHVRFVRPFAIGNARSQQSTGPIVAPINLDVALLDISLFGGTPFFHYDAGAKEVIYDGAETLSSLVVHGHVYCEIAANDPSLISVQLGKNGVFTTVALDKGLPESAVIGATHAIPFTGRVANVATGTRIAIGVTGNGANTVFGRNAAGTPLGYYVFEAPPI